MFGIIRYTIHSSTAEPFHANSSFNSPINLTAINYFTVKMF